LVWTSLPETYPTAFRGVSGAAFLEPVRKRVEPPLNPDGSVRSLGGFTTITGASGIGREGVDERLFRFGPRFAF
jgi:hypothetical protein